MTRPARGGEVVYAMETKSDPPGRKFYDVRASINLENKGKEIFA